MFHWDWKKSPFYSASTDTLTQHGDVGAEQECNCNAFQCDSVQITLSVILSAVLTWEKTKMGEKVEEGRIRGGADQQQRNGRGISVGFTHITY